jgi:hypothetical protein
LPGLYVVDVVKANQQKYEETIDHWKEGLKHDPQNAIFMDYIDNVTMKWERLQTRIGGSTKRKK